MAMRGKYGTPMNAIESRPKKHYCRQCEHYKTTCYKKKKQPTLCKGFKKKWTDAIASEVKTYYMEGR